MVASRSRRGPDPKRKFRVQLHPSIASGEEQFATVEATRVSTTGGSLKFTTGVGLEPIKVFGPGTWVTYDVVHEVAEDEGHIPYEVLRKVEKALERSRGFARGFTNVNRGIFHDDIRTGATEVTKLVGEAFTALDPFLEEEDDDDED